MEYMYTPTGVCSKEISFTIEDGIVKDIQFTGGCNGNLQGLAALAQGLRADDLVQRLKGIRCGFKSTSCPDQLACAIQQAVEAGQAAADVEQVAAPSGTAE